MAKNPDQRLIQDILTTRPIAFNADLARILGSAKAGIFLSQLLYWNGKGRNPDWIYKTVEEFEKETSLSKEEQLTAQKICVNKGVVEVKLMGLPAKRHFKIYMGKIIKLLDEFRQNSTSRP